MRSHMGPKTLAICAAFVSVVAIIVVQGLLTDSSNGEEEEGESFVVNGIHYRTLTQDTVGAYDYDDLLEEIVFPPYVIYKGNTYVVDSIGWDGYHEKVFNYIYIPETVTSIVQFTCELEIAVLIEISPLNPQFMCQDNVVYSADMTQLILYPYTKTDTSFTIPEDVSSIGENAFADNYCLEEVWIGSNIQVIEYGAFLNCRNLKWINRTSIGNTLPEGLLAIEAMAFESTALDDIHLPDTLHYIGEFAFYDTEIESLSIGINTAYIGDNAFGSCTKLETISANNAYYCGENGVLFKNHPETSERTLIQYAAGKKDPVYRIPEEVTNIGPLAFTGVQYLEELVFPYSMTIVPPMAIQSATSLKKIVLTDSILSVEENSFYRCQNLEEIEWGSYITAIGSSAFSSTNLTKLVLPDSVQYIGNDSFSGIPELKSVYIPENVKYLGSYLFSQDFAIGDIEFAGPAPRMASMCLSISEEDEEPFMLHITVQKGFVLPDGAIDDNTILTMDVKGQLPYPYENLIVVVLCLVAVILILRFVKDV